MKRNTLLGKNKVYERESRVFVAALAVLVIVLNMILFAFAQSYGWYFSIQDKQYYTLSGVTDGYFDRINAENEEIEIYFCSSEADLNANHTYGRIYDTVRQFAERYAFITVSHLDIYYDNERLTEYAKANENASVTTSSVIFDCPDRGNSLVASLADFYIFDESNASSDEMVFNGEEMTATLISRVLLPEEQRKSAYFTVGHGESASMSLRSTLYAAGYNVITADLSLFDIEEDCELIVIAAPTYDFEEYADPSKISELSRLRNFVDGGGTLMFFRDPLSIDLTRLDAFFASYGLSASDGTHLRDAEGSVGLDGSVLLAGVPQNALTDRLSALTASYTDASVLFGAASAVRLGAPTEYLSGRVATYPLLTTSSTAAEYRGNKLIGKADADGYAVAAVAEVTSGDKKGHAVLFGGTMLTYTAAMETDAYANEEVLYALLTETNGITAPIGCGQILLNTYPLENVTRETSTLWLVLLAVAVPAAIAAVGAVICIRRKRA